MLQKENREWFEKLQKFLIADERQRNKVLQDDRDILYLYEKCHFMKEDIFTYNKKQNYPYIFWCLWYNTDIKSGKTYEDLLKKYHIRKGENDD